MIFVFYGINVFIIKIFYENKKINENFYVNNIFLCLNKIILQIFYIVGICGILFKINFKKNFVQ